MRILFVCCEFPPNCGGSGIVAQQVVESKENVITQNLIIDIKSNYIKKILFDILVIWKLVIHLIQYGSYDRIVVNDTETTISFGKWLPKSLLNKLLIIIHGNSYEDYTPRDIYFKNKIRLCSYGFNRALKYCNKITCVSEYTKKSFIKSIPTMKNKNVNVSYCGLSNEYIKRCRTNNKKIDDKTVRLVSVSRIVKSKGYDHKLSIIEKYISSGGSVHWTIVGDGPYLPEIKKRAKEMDILDHITFVGRVNRELLPSIFLENDFFWLLPAAPEAFGLVYIEAQLCGLSCIGIDIGGISEAINGKTGLISNNDDAIIKYLKSGVKNHAMENNMFALQFTSDRFVRSLKEP